MYKVYDTNGVLQIKNLHIDFYTSSKIQIRQTIKMIFTEYMLQITTNVIIYLT